MGCGVWDVRVDWCRVWSVGCGVWGRVVWGYGVWDVECGDIWNSRRTAREKLYGNSIGYWNSKRNARETV